MSNYWQKRAEQRLISAEEKALRLETKLKKQFARVYKNIEAEVAKLYYEFGEETGIDYGTVRQKLTRTQKKQFRKDLEYYIESTNDPKFKQNLIALYKRARVTKLEAKMTCTKAEVHKLYMEYLSEELQLTLGDVMQEGYYKTIFDMQQYIGVGVSFTEFSPHVLNTLLEYPWSGKNYSQKLWGHVRDFSGKLENVLTAGIVQGKSNQKMASELSKACDVQYHKALTLIRTETNYIANQATALGYGEMGVDSYRYLATLDLRTSEMCREKDGKVFTMEEKVVGVNWPPLHPRCRSTTVPELDEEITGTRIARGAGGKAYKVDRNMSYEQWFDQYVKGKVGLASGKVGDTDGYSKIVKTGKLKYNGKEEADAELRAFAKNQQKSDIEHALILAADGKSVQIEGLSGTVGIHLAGKNTLKGSRVIHNHPDGDGYFGDSFSRQDFAGYFGYGISELQVVSGLGRYRMAYNGKRFTSMEAEGKYKEGLEYVWGEALKQGRIVGYEQHEIMLWLKEQLPALIYEKMEE